MFTAENVNDMFTMTETLTVKVEEPISDYDWMEIVCPPVIDPGTYFNCHIDIPRYALLKSIVSDLVEIFFSLSPSGVPTSQPL